MTETTQDAMPTSPPPLSPDFAPMARGLAHEIKNPLSTIGLNAQLIREDLRHIRSVVGDGSMLGDELARVERRAEGLARETARLRDILEDFLRFAGRIEPDLHPVDLGLLIDEIAAFFEPQAAEAGVRLRVQRPEAAVSVVADVRLLKQALLNLLLNAVQIMAEARAKGTPHGGAADLMLRVEAHDKAGAVHVTDTGPGMDAATLGRIFEPYFSTRRGGTGLGLPTTRRIIEAHAGKITVASEPGRGTDFAVYVPKI